MLAALVLLMAACSDTFDPIDHSGPPFSIFGVLDPGADTQWIRVNGLRSTLLPSRAPTGFIVSLENLGSGRVMELRDSATPYTANALGDTVYAHNFWTAERIEFGATYRLRAQSGDSAIAEAVVEIPRDYKFEEVWISEPARPYGNPGPDVIQLAGVKQVAFLGSYKYFWDQCSEAGVDRVLAPQPAGGDSALRTISIGKDTASVARVAGRPCGDKYYTKKEVEVVVSGAPWPFGQDYTTWRLNPTATNVSNGFGFVGSVLIKRLPYERCEWAGYSSAAQYCKLRYDSTTATLRGTVISGCPVPPDSLRVALQEIDPGPSEPFPRIRRAFINKAGNYEIGALRPGIRHVLTATGGAGTRAWSFYTDTLVFTAGQHATHSASLIWGGKPCPQY